MRQLLFILGLVLITIQAESQDTSKTVSLNDVVITGVRADSKTPVSQKTIKKSSIDSTYQGEELPLILDKTPSVTSQSDGGHPNGYTTFRLRGIDQTRINMTLNGVPLNEPEDQGVYTSNYPGFVNNIKSMQIQRGVGTSTNGVASYAGSINFESQNGIQKKTEIDLGGGSWNTQRINVSNSTGLSKKGFALFTDVSAYKTDGYKYHSGGSGYSFFTSGGYYSNKDIVKLTGFIGNSKNKMAWLAVSDSMIKVDRRTNDNTEGDNDNFTQTLIQLQHMRSITSNSKITSTIFYNRLDGVWDLSLASIGAGTDKINFQLGSNFGGLMSNYNYTNDKVKINFGVSANEYQRTHSSSMYPDTKVLFYKNTGTKNEVASFFKVGYDIGKLTLFADAQGRMVEFSYIGDTTMPKQTWSFFNPKAGLVYSQSSTINYYVSVGQSHREPTRTNMFGGNDNLIGFVPIKPEEVVDYELGTNIDKERLQLQTNLYYMDFKNEITLLGALGSNGLPLMTNVSKSFRSGVEIDVNYRLNKMVSLENNTNYSYNRIVDNNITFQPLYTPVLVSNNAVKITYNKIVFGITAKVNSKAYINFENTVTTPAFVLYGLNVGYESKKYAVLITGNNLTSVNYFTSGYAIGNTPYYFANAPMSLYATFKIKL